MDTIYSLVTKPINQNVAVIRVSGPLTFKVIKAIIPNFKEKPNNISFFKLLDKKDKFIDDILLLSFVSPNSFTGEDVAEIQCHGNIFVVNKILSLLNKEGLRQAEAGEFMKQAFLNNKIDLTQSEAINTLILSNDEKLSNIASQNINEKQSKIIKKMIDDLVQIIMRVRVSIDYPENQDLPEYSLKEISKNVKTYLTYLKKILDESKQIIKISKGIKIALIGKPNVGKSSLLNFLLKENRAIVSDIEGTTRDVIESYIYFDGIKTTLQDTAGLRETNDLIEKEGIKKTKDVLNKADIILVIEDFENRIDYSTLKEYESKIIKVANKSDLQKINDKDYINISIKEKRINNLVKKIKQFISLQVDIKNDDNAILTTQNQLDQIESIIENLNNAYSMLKAGHQIDVVAFEIEDGAKKLGKIIGKDIDNDYLTKLFSTFCVGK